MRKLYLEFIRGAASVCVLLYHLPETWFAGGGYHRFSLAAVGSDAVAIFFILSGCVINISYTRKRVSKKEFISSRLLRIYPQFFLGVLFALIVTVSFRRPWPPPGQLLGNILMLSTLQGFIVQSLRGNSVVWSLTFEMFFYLVFMLSIGRFRKEILRGWFVLALLMIPCCYFLPGIGLIDHFIAMFAFSAIWLVGYYVYEHRDLFYVDGYTAALSLGTLPIVSRLQFAFQWPGVDALKHFLFALIAIPFFRYCLQTGPSGKKLPRLVPLLVYLGMSILLFRETSLSTATRAACAVAPLAMMSLYWLIHRAGFREKAVSVVNRVGSILGK
ncbi:MAG TPA: acyltransferase family protein, partial [Puia sp.]|nr:acyltransferase family protein [Puia sp.]